jgi:hypothetical protein
MAALFSFSAPLSIAALMAGLVAGYLLGMYAMLPCASNRIDAKLLLEGLRNPTT